VPLEAPEEDQAACLLACLLVLFPEGARRTNVDFLEAPCAALSLCEFEFHSGRLEMQAFDARRFREADAGQLACLLAARAAAARDPQDTAPCRCPWGCRCRGPWRGGPVVPRCEGGTRFKWIRARQLEIRVDPVSSISGRTSGARSLARIGKRPGVRERPASRGALKASKPTVFTLVVLLFR